MLKFARIIAFILVFLVIPSHAQAPKSVIADAGISIPVFDYENFSKYIPENPDTVYVVNFWATWCAPCIKELPYFDQLPKSVGGRKVKVILVSLDMLKEARWRLIPFVKKRRIASEVILLHDTDADAWISKVDPKWTGSLPATMIYSGSRRAFYEQSFTSESLNETLNLFINSN